MDNSYGKVKSKFTSIRNVFLLGVGLLLISQTSLSAQITAAVFRSPSTHKEPVVSVHFKHEPLAKVLQTLARKVNVGISYETEIVPPKRVTYRARKESIFKILDDVLKDTGLYSTLSQDRKVIMIKKKPLIPAIRQETITGTVTDAGTGNTLPGVNIRVKATSTGTATAADGAYSLTVESLQDTLVFSFVGYQTQTVPINGRTSIDLALRPATVGLNEVVVTGTAGGARKRELGTSMSGISSKDIESEPVSNIEGLLRGSKSGIQSLATSGQVGGGGTLKLRGTTSITQGNYPLIFLNGIRMASRRIPSPTGTNTQGASTMASPLNLINPEDVSRVEIIKGAAATTLYGSEASSGVIQIFTQQGENGETHASFSVTDGANFWPQLGHAITSHPTNLDVDRIKRTGLTQKYNTSVRGGTDELNYFVSGSFSDANGIVETQNSKNLTATANLTFKPLDNLHISVNSTYGRRNTRFVQDGNNERGITLNTLRLDKGYKPGSRDVSWIYDSKLRSKIDNYILGINVDHIFAFSESNSLKSIIRVGMNQIEVNNLALDPFGFFFTPQGEINAQRWQTRVITAEYIGKWENQVTSKINSTLSGGIQLINESMLSIWGNGKDFSGPGKQTLSSAARTHSFEDQIQKINAGLFIQEEISLNELLYVIGGVRMDGNSTFGSSYGFEYYPKLSVSYVLSDSKFWDLDWWDSFRLRGAIGFAGKAPGAFDAVKTYSPVSGLGGQPGVTPNNTGNPDLGPERTRGIEAGFDANMLNSRMNLKFTYFNDLTTDALVPVPPTPSTGFINPQLRNVGEILSKGIEFSADFIPVRTQAFQWSVGLEITKTTENVNDLGGVEFINLGKEEGYRKGFSPPSFFGRKVKNPDEYAEPIFEENAFLGKAFPDRTYIFKTGIDIGRSLSIDARGELNLGGHMLNAVAYLNTVRGYWPPTQKLQEKRDAKGIESLTAAERAKLSPYNGYDQFIESTDFFKLRSLTVNYDLPSKWTPSDINRITLSLNGSNLFKISDYSGLDPENATIRTAGYNMREDYYTLPSSRSVQLKLSVTL